MLHGKPTPAEQLIHEALERPPVQVRDAVPRFSGSRSEDARTPTGADERANRRNQEKGRQKEAATPATVMARFGITVLEISETELPWTGPPWAIWLSTMNETAANPTPTGQGALDTKLKKSSIALFLRRATPPPYTRSPDASLIADQAGWPIPERPILP